MPTANELPRFYENESQDQQKILYKQKVSTWLQILNQTYQATRLARTILDLKIQNNGKKIKKINKLLKKAVG